MGLAELFLGKENPFSQYVAENKNTVRGAFAGLGQGTNFSAGMGNAAMGAQRGAIADDVASAERAAEEERKAQINMTAQFLREKGAEDLAMAVEGGMTSGADAFNSWYQQQNATADPFTLGAGDIRYDGQGNVIAQGAEAGPQTMITNNIGGTDEYYGAFDKALGAQDATLIDAGRNAQSNNVRLGQLETILQTAPQGAQGVMVQAAGSLGLPVEGADDIQAATALINQMVPGQRPAGSGTMSDADLALFKASLPQIINQPGGNQQILRTMKAINEYTIAQAQIAQQVANREISPAEGRALQAQVPNPLASTGGGPAASSSGNGWQVLGVE